MHPTSPTFTSHCSEGVRTKSPQTSVQTEGSEASHVYPGAFPEQSELQPIPLLDPSSQISVPSILPSPHGKVHEFIPVPIHVAPAST